MQCKIEDQFNWESLGKRISLSLIKNAGVKEEQYANLYKKFKHIPFCFDVLSQWQIQLLTGEARYYSKHANKLTKKDGVPLSIYALWSGNIDVLNQLMQDKKERQLFENFKKVSLFEVAVMSQDVHTLEWLKLYNQNLIRVAVADKIGVILVVAKTSFIEGLLWLCDFDLEIINNTGLFALLKPDDLICLLNYLQTKKDQAAIGACYYLPFYLIHRNNLTVIKWMIDSNSILLESRLPDSHTSILHFAASQGSYEMLSLIATHKKELVLLLDETKRDLVQYAFLSNKEDSVDKVLFALQLTETSYFCQLNMKCSFGIKFEFLYGRIFYQTRSLSILTNATNVLKANYKIQSIDFFDDVVKSIGITDAVSHAQFLEEISINQEFKKTRDFILLLLLGSGDLNSSVGGVPKDIIFTIHVMSLSKIAARRSANLGLSFFERNMLNNQTQSSELLLGSGLSM